MYKKILAALILSLCLATPVAASETYADGDEIGDVITSTDKSEENSVQLNFTCIMP